MRLVYLIRNLVNGKVYVGQTKALGLRKANHLTAARKGSTRYLYRSMRKHGVENFKFEVLEECADELTDEREQYWVAYFDSFNPEKGYNLTKGGDQHWQVTEETRKKIREARAKQVITTEHRKNISAGLLRTSQTAAVKESRRRGQAKRPPTTEEAKRRSADSNREWIRNNPEAALLTRQKPRHCSICGDVGHNKRNCVRGGK